MTFIILGNQYPIPTIYDNPPINNENKVITANGVYIAGVGYTGLGTVDVQVPNSTSSINITKNGTYAPVSPDIGFSSATVNVTKGNNQDITVNQNGIYTAAAGYDGLGEVLVNAEPEKYGTTISRFIGNVVNGTLQAPNPKIFKLTYVKDLANYMLYSYCSSSTSSSALILVDLSSLTTLSGTQALSSAFYGCTKLTSVDLSSLTTISGTYALNYAFFNCTSLTSVDLSNLTTVSGENALYFAFRNCTKLTSVDLSSLTILSGNSAMGYAFQDCTRLTSVDLSSLTTVSRTDAMSYAFSGCTSLTSVDLSSLTTVSRTDAMSYAFSGCTSLTSIDLSSLTTISGTQSTARTFQNCTSLTSVDLSNLTTVSGTHAMQYTFGNCTSLSTLSFPALTSTSFGSYTNQFSNMLSGVTGCTVHFPSNLQSVIGDWSDVTAGFGGTSTTVLFDLPATT